MRWNPLGSPPPLYFFDQALQLLARDEGQSADQIRDLLGPRLNDALLSAVDANSVLPLLTEKVCYNPMRGVRVDLKNGLCLIGSNKPQKKAGRAN